MYAPDDATPAAFHRTLFLFVSPQARRSAALGGGHAAIDALHRAGECTSRAQCAPFAVSWQGRTPSTRSTHQASLVCPCCRLAPLTRPCADAGESFPADANPGCVLSSHAVRLASPQACIDAGGWMQIPFSRASSSLRTNRTATRSRGTRQWLRPRRSRLLLAMRCASRRPPARWLTSAWLLQEEEQLEEGELADFEDTADQAHFSLFSARVRHDCTPGGARRLIQPGAGLAFPLPVPSLQLR